MSKAARSGKNVAPVPEKAKRLNLKALIILVGVIVVVLPGVIGLKLLQDQRGRTSLLREAKWQLAKTPPQYGLALGYVNRYLELDPDDLEALDLKAKTLADTASPNSREQLESAAKLHTLILGRDPNGPGRIETRRRAILLNLQLPYGGPALVTQAKELIAKMEATGKADAESHRLLARAYQQAANRDNNPNSAGETLDLARQEYVKAEAMEPGDVRGAAELAELYRDKLEKPAEAIRVLDDMVKATAPDPKKHAQALLFRASHFDLLPDKAREAEADLDQALKEDGSNIDIRIKAVEAALRRRDVATARRHLAAIPPESARDMRVQIAQGLADWAEMKPDEAIETWRAGLIRAGGNDINLTWRLANVLLEVGRVNESVELIERYRQLTDDPEDQTRYTYLKGISAVKLGRYDDGIKSLESIQYKVGKDLSPILHYWIGTAYQMKGEKAKALESYTQACERSNEWSTPWLASAELLTSTDRLSDATAALRRGLTRVPGDPRLMAVLARALRIEQTAKPEGQRDWAEVESLLKEADRVSPGSPDVALIRAEYLSVRFGADEGLALLEAACRQRPKSVPLWIARANLLSRLREIGKAIDVVQQAIVQAGPRSDLYVLMSSLMVQKGDVTRAKSVLQEGLTKVISAGDKAALWKTLGDVYLTLRDYPSARSAYNELAKLQPGNTEPLTALFEVAYAEGNEAEIAAAKERVKSVAGDRGVFLSAMEISLLLRPDADGKISPAKFEEAHRLADALVAQSPKLDVGYLLQGRIDDKQAEVDAKAGRADSAKACVDRAVASYRKAYTLNQSDNALDGMLNVLLREGREKEIAALASTLNGRPGQFEQRATILALRMGKKDRAEELAAQVAAGNPAGLDVQSWYAEVLARLGKPNEAEAKLKTLTAQTPEAASPWLQLLMLQVGSRKIKEAEATVEQIRQKVKTEYPDLLWAQCYRTVGNFRRAAECYRDALKRWPTEPTVLISAVTFYEQANLKDDAEAVLRGVLNVQPSNAWARRQLAQSLSARKSNLPAWKEALSLVGADTQPNDVPDDLIARAKVYANGPTRDDRLKGIAILEGLLRQLPDLAQVHEMLARMQFPEGELQGAKEHAARAAAGDRANPDAILYYAGVLLTLKEFDAAQTQLDRLAQVDANGLPVVELKARLSAARGKPAEAAAALEKAFNDRAGTPEGMFVAEKMIALLQSIGQADAVERVAKTASTIGPKGHCLYAQILASKGKSDEAEAQLKGAAQSGDPASAAAVALGLANEPKADPRWLALTDRLLDAADALRPDSVELLEKRALVRHFQGRFKDEVALYHKILALNPPSFLFLNNLAWTLCEELNDPKEALGWADKAVEKLGAIPAVLDTRGVVLTRLGQLDKAVNDLEAATRVDPNGSFYFHLARAYQKSGKSQEARVSFERARKAGQSRETLSASERPDWDALANP